MKKNYTNEEIISIMRVLDEKKRQYELDGVEITSEDAVNVLNMMSKGLSKDKAINEVLNGIYEVLTWLRWLIHLNNLNDFNYEKDL